MFMGMNPTTDPIEVYTAKIAQLTVDLIASVRDGDYYGVELYSYDLHRLTNDATVEMLHQEMGIEFE